MLDLPPGGEGSLGSPRVPSGDDLRTRTGGVRVIRAFIFDLDGTLVETEELKGLSYARAATELRPDLSEEEVLGAFTDLVGLSRQGVAVGLLRRFALEEAARDRMSEFGVDTPWQAFV